jgi:hypothetical protein
MSDISATLAERGGRYGAFIDHAVIAQGLQEVLFKAPNWSKLDPDMRQALCVIMDKTARILNGDPYYADNWHDLQGYAKLVETRILALQDHIPEAVKSQDLPARCELPPLTEAEKERGRAPGLAEQNTASAMTAPLTYIGDQEDKFLRPKHAYDIPDET